MSRSDAARPTRLRLFGTLGCHLCEEAETLIGRALNDSAESIPLESVDIADSDELSERYGLRIPVLRIEPEGKELDWPFTLNAVRDFIGLEPTSRHD